MTILLYLFLVIVGLFVAVMLALRAMPKKSPTVLGIFVTVTAVVATIRIGALWFLCYLEWSHQQTLSALPLVFLLLPEGFLIPNNPMLGVGSCLLFSLLLAVGSAVVGVVAAGLAAILKRPTAGPVETETN